MIQTHLPVTVGTGAGINLVGDWAVLIPVVTATSVWTNMFVGFTKEGSFTAINLELGIGPTGQEQRAWKSICMIAGGGNSLEFDDSWWSDYVPFNFPKDAQISARLARLGSVPQDAAIQLQLHS